MKGSPLIGCTTWSFSARTVNACLLLIVDLRGAKAAVRVATLALLPSLTLEAVLVEAIMVCAAIVARWVSYANGFVNCSAVSLGGDFARAISLRLVMMRCQFRLPVQIYSSVTSSADTIHRVVHSIIARQYKVICTVLHKASQVFCDPSVEASLAVWPLATYVPANSDIACAGS